MRSRTSGGNDKKSLLDSCGDMTFVLCSVRIRYFVKSDEDRHGTVTARLSAGNSCDHPLCWQVREDVGVIVQLNILEEVISTACKASAKTICSSHMSGMLLNLSQR